MINTCMKLNTQIDFAITTYCQAKCRSCQRTNEDTGEVNSWLTPTHMSYPVFDNILNKSPHDLYMAQFCGELGDPMMHPRITDFVDRIFDHPNLVSLLINTNGGLRTPDWYATMAEKYGRKLQMFFGIDGMSHDTNWKYREGVDWQRAMDNMVAFNQSGGRTEWHYIIFDWNWQEVQQAYDFSLEADIEIAFKYNYRKHGLISKENKIECNKILSRIIKHEK
jgi:hypothetical protein